MNEIGMIENEAHEFEMWLANANTHDEIDAVVQKHCLLVFTDPEMMIQVRKRRYEIESKKEVKK